MVTSGSHHTSLKINITHGQKDMNDVLPKSCCPHCGGYIFAFHQQGQTSKCLLAVHGCRIGSPTLVPWYCHIITKLNDWCHAIHIDHHVTDIGNQDVESTCLTINHEHDHMLIKRITLESKSWLQLPITPGFCLMLCVYINSLYVWYMWVHSYFHGLALAALWRAVSLLPNQYLHCCLWLIWNTTFQIFLCTHSENSPYQVKKHYLRHETQVCLEKGHVLINDFPE